MISPNLLSSPAFNPALFLQALPDDALPELQKQLSQIQANFNEPAQNAAQFAFDALLNAQNAVALTETAVNHIQAHGSGLINLVNDYFADLEKLEAREKDLCAQMEEKLREKRCVLNSIRVQRAIEQDDIFDPELMQMETDQQTSALIGVKKRAYLNRLLQENQNLLSVGSSFAHLVDYYPSELTEYIAKQFTEQLLLKLIRRSQFDEFSQITSIFATLQSSCANLPRNSFKSRVSAEILLNAVVLHACRLLRQSFSAFFAISCYQNNLFLHMGMMRLARALGLPDLKQVQYVLADMCQLSSSAAAYLKFLAEQIRSSFQTNESIQSGVFDSFFNALFNFNFDIEAKVKNGLEIGVFNAFVAVDVVSQIEAILSCICDAPFELIDHDQIAGQNTQKKRFRYLQKEQKDAVRKCCFKQETEADLRQFLRLMAAAHNAQKRTHFTERDFEAFQQNIYHGTQFEAYQLYREMNLAQLQQALRKLILRVKDYVKLPFDENADLAEVQAALA